MRTDVSRARLRSGAATIAVAALTVTVVAPVAYADHGGDPLTDHVVEVHETVSDAGFVHPGIGLSADDLRTAQQQVRDGVEPWASYFEAMSITSFASQDYRVSNSLSADAPDQPLDDSFTQVGQRYRQTDDSFGVLTQALMFVMTGDEVHRRNAIQGLRAWGGLDPGKFEYFADAHIHTGHPLYQFLMAAEIVRATDPVDDTTPGTYDGYDVVWHAEDDVNLLTNFAIPVNEHFTYSNTRYMNQHNFGLFARISTAIYADDADTYAQGVEWLTVNSTYDGYDNGALAPLFPLIDADDPLNAYGYSFVQHQEMGRDQAHAECDVDNLAGLARMLEVQGTLIDPADGTVSSRADAVSLYDFLDARLLQGANAFSGFMLGAEVPWVDTRQLGGTISQAYRGRIFDPLSELFHEYRYERGVDVASTAPWVAAVAERQDGPLYYNGTTVTNFWSPGDKNPEYWVAFPEELAGSVPAALPDDPALAFADHSLQLDDRTTIVTESGHSFARASVDPQGTTSVVSRVMYGSADTLGLRVRSDGAARLEVAGTAEAAAPHAVVEIPDTHGEWRYVTYPSGLVNVHFYRLISSGAVTVDLDAVTLTADSGLTPPVFADPGSHRYAAVGRAATIDLSASGSSSPVAYEAVGLPAGAVLDPRSATLTWTPASVDLGRHAVQIVADDGQSVTARTIDVVVALDTAGMIDAALADGVGTDRVYTSVTRAALDDAIAAAHAVVDDDAFDDAFTGLLEAIASLELLNPLLADGSLAYDGLVTATGVSSAGLSALVDGDNTSHTGDLRVTSFRLDFGTRFRVAVEEVAFQARFSFPNRSQGTNLYGSNDGTTWTLLSSRETRETNDLERIPVVAQHQGERYRFLRVQLDSPGVPTDPAYPGIWSIAEMRVSGERFEAVGAISAVSLSSPDAVAGRVVSGDEVSLQVVGTPDVRDLVVRIAGAEAPAVATGATTWSAATTLDDLTGAGPLAFSVDHTTAGGQVADTVYTTTDGSTLYASDESNLIDLHRAQVVTLTGAPDTAAYAAYATSMLDGDAATHSDVRARDGQFYLIWDMGQGATISLDRADFLARQDGYGTSRMSDLVLEGSNDLQTWRRLTAPTERTLEWQNLTSSGEGAYRYLRVRNGAIIGIAELRVFGTLQLDLEVVLAEAEAVQLNSHSRASAILFAREVAAVRAAREQVGADTVALAARLAAAWQLLEDPPVETASVEREWVTASTPSWDGTRDAAANGWAMFDGDPSTFTDTLQASGWVQVVPAEATEIVIDAVRVLPRSGYSSRASGVQLQGSDDGGASWQTFATLGDVGDGWTELRPAETVRTSAVRVLAAGGNTNLAEVELVRRIVDVSGLDLRLAETADLVAQDWTPGSWSAFAGARSVAQGLRAAGAQPAQDEADTAAAALFAAAEALEPSSPPAVGEVPGQGTLWSDSGWAHGLADGSFTVTMSLWWGSGATRVDLYEDGELIASQALVDSTPTAQHASFAVTGKVDGHYEYVAVLTNAAGATSTQPLVVEVTDASPGTGVLSHDNGDLDGDYSVYFDLWWGTNGTTYRLYEDGVLIDTQELVAASPAAQRTVTGLTGRASGTHTYRAELENPAGTTVTPAVVVVVR